MPAPGWFDDYTRGFDRTEFQRFFTRETPEAYRYFARELDLEALSALPWYRRWPKHARLFFRAFALRLSPARRVLYGAALISLVLGLVQLFRDVGPVGVLLFPFSLNVLMPRWADGTMWMILAFVAVNVLVVMEVADRLSLKGDLEIARDIQLAMLPGGRQTAGSTAIFGLTRPANTVGGDFYDVLRLPDGRVMIAVGDVAGKGSPAALLMALGLAMLRTLVDVGLETAALVTRLNVQVARHSPGSRFITLVYGLYDPPTGALEYVNAGHLSPLVRRADGRIERLPGGGLALGMFEQASYESHHTIIAPGEVLLLYSDGITEAENRAGHPFEDTGLEALLTARAGEDAESLARAIFAAVETYVGDARLGDDLTVLVLHRAGGDMEETAA